MGYNDDNDAAMVSQSGPTEDGSLGLVTQESGKSKVARDFLHAVNPETGVEVVFTPGETLPEWAQDVQEQRRYKARPTPKGTVELKSDARRSIGERKARMSK